MRRARLAKARHAAMAIAIRPGALSRANMLLASIRGISMEEASEGGGRLLVLTWQLLPSLKKRERLLVEGERSRREIEACSIVVVGFLMRLLEWVWVGADLEERERGGRKIGEKRLY